MNSSTSNNEGGGYAQSGLQTSSTAQNGPGDAGTGSNQPDQNSVQEPYGFPTLSLPKGGGSIIGIGEKFSVTPANGTATFSVPVKTSKGRGDSSIELSLAYNSGAGNGPFGLGWQISNQSIVRKTDKGLPRYEDDIDSDVYLLSGMDDLVPMQDMTSDGKIVDRVDFRTVDGRLYRVRRYCPRVESGFLRILRLSDTSSSDVYWEVKTDSNVTTIFGDSHETKVFDPLQPSHVFEWLPSKTYDDKGNQTMYYYKSEDSSGVDVNSLPELQRGAIGRTAARYPKRIKYGNTASRLSPTFRSKNSWMFEVVFDYGDHDLDYPMPEECQHWPVRSDPFSSRRSGFEIRMYRLCRRILMFHHFPDEPDIGNDCLVGAFTMNHELIDKDECSGLSVASTVSSVSQEHWRRHGAGYEKQCLPPLEFRYSKAKQADKAKPLKLSHMTNLPEGFSNNYQIVDLEGQGLPGVALRIDGGLQYMPNLGDGEFGAAEILHNTPNALYKQGTEQWMDLSGGGKVELVQLNGPTPGFYKRDLLEPDEWTTFKTFESFPNLSWNDKNLKFLDLTGDGIADIVIIDDNALTLYPGLGDVGFGIPSFTSPPSDDNFSETRLLFWDGNEAIYTTDMTGDGLADLVRIRHCEVCYWPNLGYGKFDNKIIMAGGPIFDTPDLFDQAYIRLADTDGSGSTDIIYLGNRVPMIYQNLSGNGLSKGRPIVAFPGIDATSNVQVLDLLGHGTSCLVWSSTLPADYGRQIQYLDLMECGKPYLLVGMENNMGWETLVTYECSTQFFARDKQAGRPWTSYLPFPVHCVEKSEVVDKVSKNMFTTRYAYHDGFFDGVEREFRGFGMVETWDSENYSSLEPRDSFYNINKYSNLPPALTKTWYCTGEYRYGKLVEKSSSFLPWTENKRADDYMVLPNTSLPTFITTKNGNIPYTPNHQERREACRAIRGSMMRSEVFSLDGTDKQHIPYLVKTSNMRIEQRQALGLNRHAVFFTRPEESLELMYDRMLYRLGSRLFSDPRISHTMALETDFYGNPLQSLVVSYGRQHDDADKRLLEEDKAAQRKSHAVLSTNSSTNSIDTSDVYLLPKPAESQAFEIINVDACRRRRGPSRHKLLVAFGEALRVVKRLSTGEYDIPFENFIGPYPSNTTVYRRLLKESRAIYRRNDLSGPLPLGVIESLALPWKNFQLVLNDNQAAHYVESGKLQANELERILEKDCYYTRLQGQSGWWADSGEAFFSPSPNSSPDEELREAREHFFLVRRSRPQWHTADQPAESFYDFDKYNLLLKEARDAYGNRLTAGERDIDASAPLLRPGNDYRLLVPFLVMDANRNRSHVLFDVIGNVVASAVMGKPEESLGDNLHGVKPILSESEIAEFFHDPTGLSKKFLGNCTSRTVYDFFSYARTKANSEPQPNWVSSLTRETHISDLAPDTDSRVFTTIAYSDGSGRSIQSKAECEPEPTTAASSTEDVGNKEENRTKYARWLTTAWVILNNKNKPVRQYEPFFADTHKFQDKAMHGVSSTILYDAIGRPVVTLYPDRTWTKIKFDPWSSEKWDKNDTVLISNASLDKDVGGFFTRLPREDYMPTWYELRRHGRLGELQKVAAQKAAASAGTPSYAFFDSLGRPCVTFEVLRTPSRGSFDEKILRQPSYLDVKGLPAKLVDTLGRTTATNVFCIGGSVLRETNMDNGTKWTLVDITGKPVLIWNARGQRFRTEYDRCRRIVGLYLEQEAQESLIERSVYGETRPDSEQHNSRGRIICAFDQSGETKTPQYDFKGNPRFSIRQLASDYKGVIDWTSDEAAVEPDEFVEQVFFDALNKPIRTVLPDGTTTTYQYNERALTKNIVTTLPDSKGTSEVITDIHYDGKGQRTSIHQGNGVETHISYDEETFRITRILTIRARKQDAESSSSSESGTASDRSRCRRSVWSRRKARLQDLRYVYDAVGNITHVTDDASKRIFFRNSRVDAAQEFTYDSLYRLVEGTGREHLGQRHNSKSQSSCGISSLDKCDRVDHANDGKAVGRYVERYTYDAVNNLLSMHHANPANDEEWTRRYYYEETSLANPDEVNNRLSQTKIGKVTDHYHYHGSESEPGNMTSMPGLSHMTYDHGERMASSVKSTNRDGEASGKTYYRYDGTGKRVRKVTESQCHGEKPCISKETIYIGGAYEVFRRYDSSSEMSLEVQTCRIVESGRQLLLIENRTKGGDSRVQGLLYRYQLGNYQGSSILEVDQNAKIISHEEYTPYGTTALSAVLENTEIPKRYRFLGKERDSETGLYHFGLRYYAAWLGRFISADPKGSIDGSNLYQYSHGNPVMLADPGGTAAAPAAPAAQMEALGWTSDALRARARDWVVFSNLPSWVSGLREWRIYGRMAAGDFAHMLQNQLLKGGLSAADVTAKFEQYMPNAKTGARLGSSFIDFMFPSMKQAFEHKLMDFTKYSEEGVLVGSELSAAFKGEDGILAQLSKHTENVAAKMGVGWGKTQLAVTIRGVEEGSSGWTAMTSKINSIMKAAGQLQPLIVHADNPALVASRGALDSAAMAVISKAGGLAKFIGAGARFLGPLAIGATIFMMPSQARAATSSTEKPNNRLQASLDLGAGVTSLGVAVVAAKGAAAITAAGAATTAVAAGVVVAGAALGGASAGAALGGYVADKVENSEFAQEHLGKTGAALAGYGTGVLAGAAAGAAVGALVGSVLPIVGTAAGAVIGGVAGALGAEAKILINKFW